MTRLHPIFLAPDLVMWGPDDDAPGAPDVRSLSKYSKTSVGRLSDSVDPIGALDEPI